MVPLPILPQQPAWACPEHRATKVRRRQGTGVSFDVSPLHTCPTLLKSFFCAPFPDPPTNNPGQSSASASSLGFLLQPYRCKPRRTKQERRRRRRRKGIDGVHESLQGRRLTCCISSNCKNSAASPSCDTGMVRTVPSDVMPISEDLSVPMNSTGAPNGNRIA